VKKLSKKSISHIYKKIIKVSGKPPRWLHEPLLDKNDKLFLNKCIESGYISSEGKFIDLFEKKICSFTKSKYSVATVNGTSALHIALKVLNVRVNDEILLPSFNFIAAANVILYCNAIPHFIDINKENLFIDEIKLEKYLSNICIVRNNQTYNKFTSRRIKAAIPMYTFGHVGNIIKIVKIFKKYKIKIIEDAAEALGTFYKQKHAGTFGDIGIISFNGNKIISTGGGGIIITNNKKIANRAKHISKTAKVKKIWKFEFNEIGYNYRMPNINAALGCSQLQKLKYILRKKRIILKKYLREFGNDPNLRILTENKNSKSNYWLQTLILDKYPLGTKEKLLSFANKKKVFLRPAWCLLHNVKYLRKYPKMNLENSKRMFNKIISLPSSLY
jgi:perosamine synthetase